ncbi:chemotaxis protein CheA [Methanocella sp. CWC-04]|uniref:Chemotaxis protein CheA n=1 Tax=Methanooceanicella nereidis TaxID=2052831 RepID=A0AAP2RDE1_9EURY|nr:chemotaxis protein CheA [Methanocella sp. CWC-04]MCD1294167.1 chemotaxis protein CheA [Methanocella sp. CWC-04]
MSQYRDMFVSEAREYLQSLNRSLLELEKCPSELSVLQEIFRSAHTLKGMSASMGFKDMETLTHRMENLLDRLRNGQLTADSGLVNVLFECLDTLESMTDDIEAGENGSVDISSISEKIDGFVVCEQTPEDTAIDQSGEEAIAVAATPADSQDQQAPAGSNEYEVHVTIEKSSDFRGIRAFLVIQNLSEIGSIITTTPSIQDLEDEKFSYDFSLVIQTDKSIDDVERKAKGVAEISQVKVKTRAVEKKEAAQKPAVKEGVKNIHSVRIDIDRLDVIMNLVGELVISRGRLFQIGSKHGLIDLNETLTMVDRSITDLQNEIMRIRMLPVDHVFNRFPRIVRDISKKQGKDINFIIEGQDTELDRTVLDEISDPLNHLIRNAVDHGIEMPEERVAKGKSATGTVKLVARRERSNVIIEVEDDGKGIDVNRVKQKAIDRGLLTEAQAAAMGDDEALMLIFKPGLSTAEKLSEVSGRGVGMDIVKTKVESLGGTVKIDSKPGEGTKTILKLPPTIAIVQALLIKVGDEHYAVSITNVVESEYVTESDIKTISGKEVIVIRDTLMPLIRLDRLFDIGTNDHMEKRTVIVIEKGDEKIGLLVDFIESQQEIFVKPLSGLLQNIRGFEGVTIMGDGRVVPILDISTLVEVKK